MEKVKVIIIDDERLARDIIKNYLNEHDNYQIIAECSNGFDGIKAINEYKPDIVFLDVQMPKLTGFEMLELLDDQPPVIIFTTAYEQYAVKAFELNAVDYLLKPFAYDRFYEALSKALKSLENTESSTLKIERIKSYIEEKNEFLTRVAVKSNQNITIIPVNSIRLIEAQDDYVQIFSDKGKHLKKGTMKYYESRLNPTEFVRIHRSYIVRIDEIKKIELLEKESYTVILPDKTSLPVSKTGYAKLKELLK